MRIFFLLFLLFFASKDLFSQSLFETDFHIVKFQSNNIDVDKENKINAIKINSFKNVLQKILNQNNYIKIQEKNDINFVNNFVLNIKIIDEKIINENYYLKIKINFNENIIIDYFINNKINYVNFLPNKFLLIFFEENLFENENLSKNNKFYSFIINSNDDFLKENYLIPNLDFNDRFILNQNNLNFINFNQNLKLNSKYKINNQVFIYLTKDNNYYSLHVFLINEKNKVKINEILVDKLNYSILLKNIYYDVIDKWKNFNSIDTQTTNILNCNITINNTYELKFLRNFLSSNRIINNYNLQNIKFNENTYKLEFFGNIENLISTFEKARLNLFFENNECKVKLK